MTIDALISCDESIYVTKNFFTAEHSATNRTKPFDTVFHADSEYSSFKSFKNHLTGICFNFSTKTKFIEKTLLFSHSTF